MKTERTDHVFGEMLEQATPEMADGWEARACAATTATRSASSPSNRRRMLALAGVTVLLLTTAAGLMAGLNLWLGPVEGTLHVRSNEYFTPPDLRSGPLMFSSFFRDEFDLVVSCDEAFARDADHVDVSPVSDEVVFHIAVWPPTEVDVWRSDFRGTHEVALTKGLGGVNCAPVWSPDGSMIAFQHAEPEDGQLPCEAGFAVWVMNSDGTAPRPVLPPGYPPQWQEDWSPDGTHLLVTMETEPRVWIVSLDGTSVEGVPNVQPDAAWSPDGTRIASSGWEDGVRDGVPGVWRQLLLTNLDTGRTDVLIEQFLPYDEIEALFPADTFQREHRVHDCQHWAGPVDPVWSPSGDKIAFLAAMPFDPRGVHDRDYRAQVEVWMYDLKEDTATQITDDELAQYGLSWKP